MHLTRAKKAYVPDGVKYFSPKGNNLTTAKIQMKATATVTPEATPLTLLGQSSPSSSQGMVPTPAPNTEIIHICHCHTTDPRPESPKM